MTEQHEDDRPQPRYGAYAANSGDTSGQSGSGSEGTPGSDAQQPNWGGQHNPYGQPSWGQPGPTQEQQQGHNPYAGPYGSPPVEGNPAASWQQGGYQQGGGYAAPAPAQKPKRPSTLTAALTLFLIAGVTSLAWGIYVFVTLPLQDPEAFLDPIMQESMVTAFENDPQLQGLSQTEMLEFTLFAFAVMALVWAVVLLAIYITAAFLGAMAGTPGRILATIWAALSLFFLALGHDGASYGLILVTVSASITALVLLWMPPSNRFVRERRAFKDAQKGYYPGAYGPPQGGYQPHPPQGSNSGGPYGN